MQSYKDDTTPLIRNKIALSVSSVAFVKGPINTVYLNLIRILMWTTKKDTSEKNRIVLGDVFVSAIVLFRPSLNYLMKKCQLHKDHAG